MNKAKWSKRILAILVVAAIVLISLPGAAAGSAPIGMDEAIQILIEEIIEPATLDHDTIAYMLKEPLQAGDVVTPQIGASIYQITEDTYFIFIDDSPAAFYEHPVRFAFISATDGNYAVGDETWPPLVNGEELTTLEESGQVELLRFYSTAAQPDPVVPIISTAPEGDYGDAPDGQEAYPWTPGTGGPVQGRFPTLYNTANSILGDPGIHCLNTGKETLGISVSRETDATDPLDPDGMPNLVDADSDEWKFVEIDISTTPATASLTLDITVTADDVDRYINVLVDFDQNGEWGGDVSGKEWAVINYEVDVAPGNTKMITTPSFDWGSGMVVPSPVWLRVTLTRDPVDEAKFAPVLGGWDGSGQFQYGEIEDCLVVLTWTGPDNKPRPSDPPDEDGPEPGELPKVKHGVSVSNYRVIVNGGDHAGQAFVQASYDRMSKVLDTQGYDDTDTGEFGPDATPADIGQHMADLAAKLKCADHVFIYIVGHGNATGVRLQGSQTFITPADLKAWLCKIGPCDKKRCDLPETSQCVCVVIESCKSGTFIDSGLPEKECQIINTACTKTELSYGYGRGAGRAAGGWFGRFWVEDLRNPTDKIVDCNEAFTTANAKTKAEAAKWGVPQTPQQKGKCCDCDCEPPENKCCYPRYPSDELNPDGTCPVTIIDTVIDEGTGVKRVVASIGGNVEFEADDINLPEYEFSFTINLLPGEYVLVIEAWDYVDHYMYKEEPFTVKEGGGVSTTPLVPSMTEWGMIGLVIALAGGTVAWQLRRRKVNLKV